MEKEALTGNDIALKNNMLHQNPENVSSLKNTIKLLEERYKNAFEYTGTAMIILDENGIIIEGNHKLELITGYSRSEIGNKKPFTEYVAKEEQQRLVSYFKKRRLGDIAIPTEYEFKLRHKNGQVRTMLINVSMIPDSNHSLVSLLDITDRSKAEMELRNSEKRFKDIAMLLPAMICEWDNSFHLRYINAKGQEILGITKEDIDKGLYLFDLVLPQDKTKAEKDRYNIFHGDFGNAQVYTIKNKAGKLLHMLVNGAPVLPEGGIRMCVVDITERVEAEEKLRENEKRFKTIVSWSPIGIALCNAQGKTLETNSAFKRLFNYKEDPDGPFDVFPLLNLPPDKQVDLDQGKSIEHETVVTGSRKNEPDKYYLWYITPLDKNNDSLESYLVQVQDASLKKQAEEARIKHAEKETEEAKHVIANLRKEIKDRSSFQNMVSRSPLMKEIFDILPEVANTPATVLINGDSGTGKELIARSLHELSARKSKPFIAINCSALPDNLLESELFGYKAGAFTDAKKDKPGTFSRADTGTIFLDEIGDISPAMQVKLLRVLQEKTFEPLGSSESVKVDVRIIAATNKDLQSMVKTGQFREDLLYRINVLVIKLPPLRDRRTDIPILCDHFIERFNSRYNKQITGILQEAENALLAYDYPGNIRELENIIEHAFIFCKDANIGLAHLPQQFKQAQTSASMQSLAQISDFDTLEKMFLESVLKETGGSKIRAAEKLGIHKATLFRKLKKLGIALDTGKDEE